MKRHYLSNRFKLSAALAIPLVVACLATTSFASTASAATKSAHQSLTTFNIAVVPYSGLAPIGLGINKGIFKHYGFSVNLNDSGNVTNGIADIQGGTDQLAYVSTALLVGAVKAGESLRCVAPVGLVSEPIPGYPQEALVVKSGSSITSVADLDGKTLALPTATGANEETAKYAVQKGGGTWSSIHIVTSFNYTEMLTALSNNEISAAFLLSPYIEQGTAAGQITILDDLDSVNAGTTGSCFAGTNSYIASHKGQLRKFVMAMDQAILFTAGHPRDVTDKLIASVSDIPVATVLKSPVYNYTDSLQINTLAQYENFMVSVGALSRPILRPAALAWVAPGTPMTTLLFNGAGKYTGAS